MSKATKINESVKNYDKYVEEQEYMKERVEWFLSKHPTSELMLIVYEVFDKKER